MHETIGRCIGTFIVATAVLGVCIGAHARDQIAFVRDGNVWLMTADGNSQTKLTSSGECSGPSWSPDGKFLLFISGDNVWKMQMSDSRLRRLTNSGDCTAAAWRPGTDEVWYCRSPQLGKTFQGDAPQDGFIARIGAAGEGYKRCFPIGASFASSLSWHPKGGLLSVSWRDGYDAGGVRVYDRQGRKQSTPGAVANERWEGGLIELDNPAWSPVRPELIAMTKLYSVTPERYFGNERGECLVVVDTGARRQRVLHEELGTTTDEPCLQFVFSVTWSPDGQAVAYSIYGSSGKSAWLVGIEDCKPRKIAADADQLAWRPR